MKWQISSLESISELIQTGKTPPTKEKEYFNGNLNWYTPGDLGTDKYLTTSVRTITNAAIKEHKAIGFPGGTVLITCIGEIGKVGIANHFCSSNQQITGIKPKKFICPDYFYYWVVAHKKLFESHSNKAVVPILNNTALKRIKFRYPTLPEQKQIAEILDRADGLRRKRQQTIDLLDELLRSIFLNMFGDPVKNPKGWKVALFKYIIKDTQYGTSEKANIENKGIPILRMNNLTYDGRLDLSDMKWIELNEQNFNKYTVQKGDLLFNRTNSRELVGKTVIWNLNDKYAFAGYLVRLRFNSKLVNPYYVSSYLNSDYGKKLLYSKAQPSINMSNISASKLLSFKIPLPPLELQNRFAEILIQVESVKEKMQKSLEEMDNLFHSLMQRAFKGELKLDKVLPDMMATDAETFEELSQLEDNKSAAKSKPNEQKESPPDQWLEFREETDPLEFPIHDCYKIKEHLQDIKSDEEEPVDIIVFDGDENSNLERIDKLKKIIQEHLEMISDYKGRTFKIITMDYDNDPSLKSFLQTKLKEALQENLEMCRDDKEGPIEIIDYFWDENANNQYIPVYKLDKALQKNMEMIQDEKGRRLKIIDYFFDENANNQDMPFYKLKKTFQENLGMINDDKSSRIKIIKLHCDKNARLKSLLSSPKMLNLYTKMGTNTISRNYLALNKDIHKHIPLPKNKVLQQLLQIVKDDKRLASILAKDFVIYLYLLFGDTPFNFEDIKEKFSNAAKSYEEISDLIFRLLRESLNEEDIYLKQCFFDETFDSGDEKLNKKLRGTIGFRVYENKK